MSKKKSKAVYFIIPIVLFLAVILFFSIKYATQQTALPNDLQLTREEYFPKIDTLSKNFKDTIVLSANIEKESIYKMEVFLTACSTKAEIYMNSQKIGEMDFRDCESSYYDDNDNMDYIHYQTSKFEKYYYNKDFPNSFNYEIKLTQTEGRKWSEKGQIITADEPFNPELRIWRQVQCTRSSQCIPITLIMNGEEKDIQPICSTKNKCSIELSDLSVEDAKIEVLPEELIPIKKDYSWVVYPIVAIITVVLAFSIWRMWKKENKKRKKK